MVEECIHGTDPMVSCVNCEHELAVEGLLREIVDSAEKCNRATPDEDSDSFVATPLIRRAERLLERKGA